MNRPRSLFNWLLIHSINLGLFFSYTETEQKWRRRTLSRNRLYTWSFYIVFVLFIMGCKNEKAELYKTIDDLFYSGNKIDQDEWEVIKKYSQNNKIKLGKGKAYSDSLLYNEILNRSAKMGLDSNRVYNPFEKEYSIEDTKVNFYIENSFSMDGYMNGKSDYKDHLFEQTIWVKDEYGFKNLGVYYINTDTFSVLNQNDSNLTNFYERLSPSNPQYKRGERKESKFQQIIKRMIASTSNATISILYSDCIFSLGEENKLLQNWDAEKWLITEVFNDGFNQVKDLSCYVVRMNSQFNGTYYDLNDKRTAVKGIRPYFIWMIGAKKDIDYFRKRVAFNGIQNEVYFTRNLIDPFVSYSVLPKTERSKPFGTKKKRRAIKEIDFPNDLEEDLVFSVGLDLSGVDIPQSYKLNKTNYSISDGFVIDTIIKYSQETVEKIDFKKFKEFGFTHFIVVRAKTKSVYEACRIELMNNLPNWIARYSIDSNDSKIKMYPKKTFGLKHLLDGVNASYKKNNENATKYFSINIKVNKK